MGNDQGYVYDIDGNAMLKLIADPDSVRIKICPALPDGTWDEVDGAVSISADRQSLNHAIKELRRMRDRVFGKDE